MLPDPPRPYVVMQAFMPLTYTVPTCRKVEKCEGLSDSGKDKR